MLGQRGAVWILYCLWYSTSGGTLHATFVHNITEGITQEPRLLERKVSAQEPSVVLIAGIN